MTIGRTQIGKAHVLKNSGLQQEVFQPVLQTAGCFIQGIATGQCLDNSPVNTLGIQIIFTGTQPG